MSKIDGSLRSLFRANVPGDWVSIESGSTGGGIPDSNFCIDGVEGWVENKKADGWAVTLEPEQVGWLARRARHGGRTWVAVRQRAPAGPRRPPRDALWLIPGSWAARAKAEGLRGPWLADAGSAVAAWQGGPRAWDWRAIAARLVA